MQVNNYININQAAEQLLEKKSVNTRDTGNSGLSFQDILAQKTGTSAKTDELKFSRHAAGRLEDRNITLTQEQLERLNEGATKAREKGIQNSLVMIDKLALIVNVPNRTVVTAMEQTDAGENIFTNIDGAVIA